MIGPYDARARIMVVAAYGLLLPVPVLELFAIGCINIHASVLPRWRGAAPIQRALLAGDRETGISIMRMDAGLDTGQLHHVAIRIAHVDGPHEAVIDWSQPAPQIERQVRAFNPQPGAHTTLRGQLLRVWRARALERPAVPAGRVVETTSSGILVACGSGVLAIEELQRAGAKRLSAADFLRGISLSPGEPLGV